MPPKIVLLGQLCNVSLSSIIFCSFIIASSEVDAPLSMVGNSREAFKCTSRKTADTCELFLSNHSKNCSYIACEPDDTVPLWYFFLIKSVDGFSASGVASNWTYNELNPPLLIRSIVSTRPSFLAISVIRSSDMMPFLC